jgi:hypothetical protein
MELPEMRICPALPLHIELLVSFRLHFLVVQQDSATARRHL